MSETGQPADKPQPLLHRARVRMRRLLPHAQREWQPAAARALARGGANSFPRHARQKREQREQHQQREQQQHKQHAPPGTNKSHTPYPHAADNDERNRVARL